MAKTKKRIAVLRVAEFTTIGFVGHDKSVGTVIGMNGQTHNIFSTGLLEFAIHRFDTYVISSRTRIAPVDRWWAKQVPMDHVILVDKHSVGEEEFFKLLPWYELYKRINLPWPGHDKLQLVIAHLRMHGVLFGDDVRIQRTMKEDPFMD